MPAADADPSVTVVPYPDGPLIVRGDFALQNVDGTPIAVTSKAVALCRCGRSAVKPFCDGSHKFTRQPTSTRSSRAVA